MEQGDQFVKCDLDTRRRLLTPVQCATMGSFCVGRAELAGDLPEGTARLPQDMLGRCVVSCLAERDEGGSTAQLVGV